MAANEPPYLTVGTDVSARYKGAFCEAKVKKVNRLVKCKVVFENNLGTLVLPDDQLRGTLRLNSYVEARHPEKNQFFSAVINKIFDYSQYTVVFDDGDETTLRRNSLCLKSGRHFAESETLDRLPLTNPEHFGTPVLQFKGKRQRRSAPSCSSIDDESSSEGFSPKGKKKCTKKDHESDLAKVVCVDIGDKRKKDSWFPALVVSPSSQEMKISQKDQYLVRSFKDGKYYPVKKKEARMFTKEIGARVESSSLKIAVDKAMLYLNKDEIPPHWDWDVMMGQDVPSEDDEIKDSEVESSDDEPSEEKDRFVAQLYKFMDERGTPINRAPTITGRDLNLYKLFSIVQQMGGYNRVTNQNKWRTVYIKMGLTMSNPACSMQIKKAYKRYLHSFEDFNRKLGCTMVCNTRTGLGRHRSDRSIIMTRKREQNLPLPKSKVVKDIKKTSQEKNRTEEASERVVRSRSLAKPEESEQNKQKEVKSVVEPKVEKMETRGSTKIDQDKSKEVKVTPTKEKGKKELIKVKEEKNKDKTTPKNNGKETEKEKVSTLPSPPKVKVEDEKELQPKPKIGKTDEKELVEKASRISESDPKRKRIEANVRIGDRVKVKYGRGKQHKMYEAKVLKIERENGEKKYYVHYTGWNMRYDEWIRKGRIIEVVDGKSLPTKNPKRSHSWQDSQTKAILKRSMLFASPRKHCSSSPKIPSSITLRTRRQNSAPELRSTNASETRKLRSQLFGESPSIESNDILSLSENHSESLDDILTPSGETEILNTQNKPIKQEQLSEPEDNIEERIDDLVKDENSWDAKESNLFTVTEKPIKKEAENVESVKSAEIVLKACTVNLSQESRTSIFSSDTSVTLDDPLDCMDNKIITGETLDASSESFSPDQISEMNENSLHTENKCIEKQDDVNEKSTNRNFVFLPFCNDTCLEDDKDGKKETSNKGDTDYSTKIGIVETKGRSSSKLTFEDKQEEYTISDTEGHNILSEIAEQLVDLNKTIPDHSLSDEDLPPTLERKPDLIPVDNEREIYETQPELKRAVSEIEEVHNNETSVTKQNGLSYQDVCRTLDSAVGHWDLDAFSYELEHSGSRVLPTPISVPENSSELTSNTSDQEKIAPEANYETGDHSTVKKEKKKKPKTIKNEGDGTNADETNETDDSIKNKNGKSPLKRKLDSNQDGEVKKKSKKLKDKKKKLKKHKNLKDLDEKDGTKEGQDGDPSKKEKRKKDESTTASVLGQKKGESSKKLKKCRKNKDKNSPKKGDSPTEKKMKRKKKKKESSLLEVEEKSSNDQATSDSDKAMKLKKGKKKDKKKSKKKACEPLELLDRSLEKTVDIPEEKPSTEDGDKVDDIDTTLEADEKLKEDISFLLCQEHVPASPLGNESAEEQDVGSFVLSDPERNDVTVQSTIESPSYAEHSLSSELPSIQSEGTNAVISKHSEILTVLDNTPPTTPESTETFLTNSPSYDQDLSSPISTSPHKDMPEAESSNLHQETSHLNAMESEDSMSQTESAILFLANQAVSRKKVFPSKVAGLPKRPSDNNDILSPRKKKAPKLYSSDSFSSKPKSVSKGNKGEQKDVDVFSTATNSNTDSASSDTTSIQPIRTSKFNFYVPLDETMDSDKRIAIIQDRLSELKKAYMTLKAEVAMIDRHRKKAKRKERESAAAVASTLNTPTQKDNADGS